MGTERIESIWNDLRSTRARALMPFICAGYPEPGSLARTLAGLQRAGAPIVEIGIPYSDPIADGPVIAAAMHCALAAGASPGSILDEIAEARGGLAIGIVLMVSMSIVYAMGPDTFAARAAAAGCDGLIVPDLPVEESGDVLLAARDAGLTLSLLVAPTTPATRASAIAEASTGFVYLLARTGLTGERPGAPEVRSSVAALRRHTLLPIACGFGITTADHVRTVVQHADAAIVGSALVRRMGEAHARGEDPAHAAETLTRELAAGC